MPKFILNLSQNQKRKKSEMIPVNQPVISEEAKKYVMECLETGWISSAGKYVSLFEEKFATYIGTKFATTTTNGTTALHLAMEILGIGEGDEVIMPDLTIMSCAFAALYVGAKPVLVDVEKETGNIDPNKIEAAITSKTKAIMVVHLYGHPADLDPILAIAKKHHLLVIEDAAEAHGAEYKGKKVGSFGDVSCFSFYGNKIITTGEGGMVLMNNEELYKKAILIKDLAHKVGQRFYHEQVGYNFRMTNLQAALGVSALEHIDEYIAQKRHMAALYRELLHDVQYLRTPIEQKNYKSVYWMYAVELSSDAPFSREVFMERLKEKGVDTRTYFYPLHAQPVLQKMYTYDDTDYPVSDDLSARGLYLPSGLAITDDQIKEVAATIKSL